MMSQADTLYTVFPKGISDSIESEGSMIPLDLILDIAIRQFDTLELLDFLRVEASLARFKQVNIVSFMVVLPEAQSALTIS